MKSILFGNSLILLGIAIIDLADMGLLYVGMIWVSYLLFLVGFFMAVIGFFLKDN